jgi:GNAT superfamily N-acetyltransferase
MVGSRDVIRPARAGEAEVVAGIQRDAAVAAFAHIFPPERYPFPIDDVRQRWVDAFADPEVSVVIAEDDGGAVGAACYRDEWLDGLYVVRAFWGRGVGAELHDYVLDRLRERGSERCHLWVLEENHRARGFYERRGWQLNGETRVVPFPPNPIDVGYTIEL